MSTIRDLMNVVDNGTPAAKPLVAESAEQPVKLKKSLRAYIREANFDEAPDDWTPEEEAADYNLIADALPGPAPTALTPPAPPEEEIAKHEFLVTFTDELDSLIIKSMHEAKELGGKFRAVGIQSAMKGIVKAQYQKHFGKIA